MHLKRFLIIVMGICFLVSHFPVNLLAADRSLPLAGQPVYLSSKTNHIAIKGLKLDPFRPMRFEFLLDKGDQSFIDKNQVTKESEILIKYFLACLTIPQEDLWVNLSPYEKDRIVPKALGQTDLGRDLLAQDYILKQLSASLLDPRISLGKKFWNRVYQQVGARFGSTKLPVNTFNKVWILADTARMLNQKDSAYVLESHLKVMMEQDLLAREKGEGPRQADQVNGNKLESSAMISDQIYRDIILPEIEREVNEGEHFARLRQIYEAFILATWYKNNLRTSLINATYANKTKIDSILSKNDQNPEQIYAQYLKAYKMGAIHFISENESAPRKYFSGGTQLSAPKITSVSPAQLSPPDKNVLAGASFVVTVDLTINQAMAPSASDNTFTFIQQIDKSLTKIASNPATKSRKGFIPTTPILHNIKIVKDMLKEENAINSVLAAAIILSYPDQFRNEEDKAYEIMNTWFSNNQRPDVNDPQIVFILNKMKRIWPTLADQIDDLLKNKAIIAIKPVVINNILARIDSAMINSENQPSIEDLKGAKQSINKSNDGASKGKLVSQKRERETEKIDLDEDILNRAHVTGLLREYIKSDGWIELRGFINSEDEARVKELTPFFVNRLVNENLGFALKSSDREIVAQNMLNNLVRLMKRGEGSKVEILWGNEIDLFNKFKEFYENQNNEGVVEVAIKLYFNILASLPENIRTNDRGYLKKMLFKRNMYGGMILYRVVEQYIKTELHLKESEKEDVEVTLMQTVHNITQGIETVRNLVKVMDAFRQAGIKIEENTSEKIKTQMLRTLYILAKGGNTNQIGLGLKAYEQYGISWNSIQGLNLNKEMINILLIRFLRAIYRPAVKSKVKEVALILEFYSRLGISWEIIKELEISKDKKVILLENFLEAVYSLALASKEKQIREYELGLNNDKFMGLSLMDKMVLIQELNRVAMLQVARMNWNVFINKYVNTREKEKLFKETLQELKAQVGKNRNVGLNRNAAMTGDSLGTLNKPIEFDEAKERIKTIYQNLIKAGKNNKHFLGVFGFTPDGKVAGGVRFISYTGAAHSKMAVDAGFSTRFDSYPLVELNVDFDSEGKIENFSIFPMAIGSRVLYQPYLKFFGLSVDDLGGEKNKPRGSFEDFSDRQVYLTAQILDEAIKELKDRKVFTVFFDKFLKGRELKLGEISSRYERKIKENQKKNLETNSLDVNQGMTSRTSLKALMDSQVIVSLVNNNEKDSTVLQNWNLPSNLTKRDVSELPKYLQVAYMKNVESDLLAIQNRTKNLANETSEYLNQFPHKPLTPFILAQVSALIESFRNESNDSNSNKIVINNKFLNIDTNDLDTTKQKIISILIEHELWRRAGLDPDQGEAKDLSLIYPSMNYEWLSGVGRLEWKLEEVAQFLAKLDDKHKNNFNRLMVAYLEWMFEDYIFRAMLNKFQQDLPKESFYVVPYAINNFGFDKPTAEEFAQAQFAFHGLRVLFSPMYLASLNSSSTKDFKESLIKLMNTLDFRLTKWHMHLIYTALSAAVSQDINIANRAWTELRPYFKDDNQEISKQVMLGDKDRALLAKPDQVVGSSVLSIDKLLMASFLEHGGPLELWKAWKNLRMVLDNIEREQDEFIPKAQKDRLKKNSQDIQDNIKLIMNNARRDNTSGNNVEDKVKQGIEGLSGVQQEINEFIASIIEPSESQKKDFDNLRNYIADIDRLMPIARFFVGLPITQEQIRLSDLIKSIDLRFKRKYMETGNKPISLNLQINISGDAQITINSDVFKAIIGRFLSNIQDAVDQNQGLSKQVNIQIDQFSDGKVAISIRSSINDELRSTLSSKLVEEFTSDGKRGVQRMFLLKLDKKTWVEKLSGFAMPSVYRLMQRLGGDVRMDVEDDTLKTVLTFPTNMAMVTSPMVPINENEFINTIRSAIPYRKEGQGSIKAVVAYSTVQQKFLIATGGGDFDFRSHKELYANSVYNHAGEFSQFITLDVTYGRDGTISGVDLFPPQGLQFSSVSTANNHIKQFIGIADSMTKDEFTALMKAMMEKIIKKLAEAWREQGDINGINVNTTDKYSPNGEDIILLSQMLDQEVNLSRNEGNSFLLKEQPQDPDAAKRSLPEVPFDESSGVGIRVANKFLGLRSKQLKEKGIVIPKDGERLHVVIVGPGRNAHDFKEVLKAYPKARHIDIIDPNDITDEVDKIINSVTADEKPTVTFHQKNLLEMSGVIQNADIVFALNIFDRMYWDDKQLDRARHIIWDNLKLNGVFVFNADKDEAIYRYQPFAKGFELYKLLGANRDTFQVAAVKRGNNNEEFPVEEMLADDVSGSLLKPDTAMIGLDKRAPGGIKLNQDDLRINVNKGAAQEFATHVDQATLVQLQSSRFRGFIPIIVDIKTIQGAEEFLTPTSSP